MQDDLAIPLFFLTSAVLAGYEAMKATGWRVKAFGVLAALFVIVGFAWHWLKEIYPPATKWVVDVATSPQSWFVLIVLALVLLAITGRRTQARRTVSIHKGTPDDPMRLVLIPDLDLKF